MRWTTWVAVAVAACGCGCGGTPVPIEPHGADVVVLPMVIARHVMPAEAAQEAAVNGLVAAPLRSSSRRTSRSTPVISSRST